MEARREAAEIIGRIIDRTATDRDQQRLEHLTWLQAHRLKRPKPRPSSGWIGPWFGKPKPSGGK